MNNLPFVQGTVLNAYLHAEEGLKHAQAHGCSHWYVDGSLDSEMPSTWTEVRIDALNRMIQETGVRPVFHGNYRAPLSTDIEVVRTAAVASVLQEIDVCAKLHAPLILHGGAIVEPRLVESAKVRALDKFVESLLEIERYARSKQVELWLENLSNYTKYRPFHYIFTKLNEFKYVFDRIPSVKFILDVGHANVGNADPFEGFDEFHQRIVGLSLSNNEGEKDTHFPLAYGTVRYPELVRKMVAAGWRGLIVFETRGRTPDKSLEDLASIYAQVYPGVPAAAGTAATS